MPYNPGVVADGGKYILAGALSASKAIGDAIGDRLDEHRKKVQEADNLGGVYAHYFGNDPEKMGAFAQGSIGTKRALVTNALSDQIDAERKAAIDRQQTQQDTENEFKRQAAATSAAYYQLAAHNASRADATSAQAAQAAQDKKNMEEWAKTDESERAWEKLRQEGIIKPPLVYNTPNGGTIATDSRGSSVKVIPSPRAATKTKADVMAGMLGNLMGEPKAPAQSRGGAAPAAGVGAPYSDLIPGVVTPVTATRVPMGVDSTSLQALYGGAMGGGSVPAAAPSASSPFNQPSILIGGTVPPPDGLGAPYADLMTPQSVSVTAPAPAASQPAAAAPPAAAAAGGSQGPIPGRIYTDAHGRRALHNPDGTWTALP